MGLLAKASFAAFSVLLLALWPSDFHYALLSTREGKMSASESCICPETALSRHSAFHTEEVCAHSENVTHLNCHYYHV